VQSTGTTAKSAAGALRARLVERSQVRVVLAFVDGGRAILPPLGLKAGEWITMDCPYHLARLVDGFARVEDFDDSVT